MGGFGCGMIYLPSIVSVGYYFEKRRALATGIAVCGSGVGCFTFAPLANFLLEVNNYPKMLYLHIFSCAIPKFSTNGHLKIKILFRILTGNGQIVYLEGLHWFAPLWVR